MNKSITLLLCIVTLVSIPLTRSSAQIFKNESGGPTLVANIGDEKGLPYAAIYVTGHEMQLGGGWVVSGAGYVEAVKGRQYALLTTLDVAGKLVVVGLKAKKIEWDEKGKTIAITELGPELSIMMDGLSEPKTLHITSHTLKDGVIQVKLEGKGDKEYAVGALYAKGVFVRPDDFLK